MRLIPSLVLAAGVVLAGCGTTPLNTKADVESFLRQNISPGASRDAVISMLEAQEVQHSGRSLPHTLYATVRPANSALAKRGFQVRFEFDGDDRLTRYEVAEKYMGP